MTRHIVGLLCGYLLFGLSSFLLFRVSRVDPRAVPTITFAIAATLAGSVLSAAAGFFAATVSPFGARASRQLALLIAAVAIASALLELGKGSLWSQGVAVLLLVPACVAGGMVADRQVTRGL